MPDLKSTLPKNASSEEQTRAGMYFKEFETLRNNRANTEQHWQEIAQRMAPNEWRLFLSQGTSTYTKGDKRNEYIYDATAMVASERFAAVLDSLLTPRNNTWHRLTTNNPELSKLREVKLYFDELNRTLFHYRYAPKANFASQNNQIFRGLGTYGSGAMYIDPLQGERGLRYKSIHLSEIFFRENHQGIVDACFRYFSKTARQAVQQWGQNLPQLILDQATKNPDREFFFLHVVEPRADRDPLRVDSKGLPYASFYFSEEGKRELTEGGYRSFPYAISRYTQVTGEVYGRSPGMSVLPAVKTLNEEKKTILKQGHRALDPVLLAHDDGVLDAFSLLPGSVNFGGVNRDGRPLVHALPVGNIAIGKDLMDDERALINDAFLITLFQILVETPQQTATEVLERVREKNILLTPTVGRQNSEYLGPTIVRELDVLDDQRVLPPIPPVLIEAQGEYSIQYDSPLARAQRAEEAAGLMRAVENTLSIVNVTQDPTPLDHYDWDVIVPEINAINGVPTKWLRSLDQIQAMRQQRAQANQVEQAARVAPGAAALIKAGAAANKAS